jgi:hypothetical protein
MVMVAGITPIGQLIWTASRPISTVGCRRGTRVAGGHGCHAMERRHTAEPGEPLFHRRTIAGPW